MQKLRKLMVGGVMMLTILSMSMVVVPAANAATAQAGDLIKMDGLSSVYYLGADNLRYPFPNEATYFSWYGDWSGVKTVSQAELVSYKLASKNVVVRAGTRLVKITTDPTVYAVTANGVLHSIVSEANAIALWGANWAKNVIDVPDSFFTNYTVGADLTAGQYPAGSLIKLADSADVYYINTDGTASKFADEAAFLANGFKMTDVKTAPSTYTLPTMGDEITAEVSTLVDTSQGGGSGTGVTPGAGTGLTVALSAANPAATVLAGSTVYNDMLKINVTASNDGPVNIKSVTVTKTGLVANTNISGLSVWDDQGVRHGNIITSLNSDGGAIIAFGSSPITVAAGTTKTITVKANLGSSATSGTLGFKVAQASDIVTDGAAVSGSFPVMGNTFSLTSASNARYTLSALTAGGTLSGNLVVGYGNLSIGDTHDVFKFQITENSGNEDLKLSSVTLFAEGTMRDADLSELKLYSINDLTTVIGTASGFVDRYATFNLATPYTIAKGNSQTFVVKAKIADGSGRNFRLQIQNDYDIMVQGATNAFYLAPTYTTWSAVAEANSWFQMNPGSLTATRATESPSGNAAVGTTNQVLGVFDLKAVGEDLEIRKVYVNILHDGLHLLAGTLRVMDYDGTNTYLSTTASTSALYTQGASHGAGSDQTLSQYINIPSGTTKKIKVVADIASTATSTEAYTIGLKNFYARRLSTLDYTTLATSWTDASQISVSTGGITVTKNASVPNSAIIAGSTNVKMGSFSLQASSAGNVNVSQVQVGFTSPTTATPSSDLANLKIKVGSTEYAYSGSIGSSANSISTPGLVVTTGGITVDVYADILNNSSLVSGRTFTVMIPSSGITGTRGSESVTSPTSNKTGQTMQVGAATLTIAKEVTSDTNTKILVAGLGATTHVPVYKLSLTAGADNLTLEQLALTVSSTNSDARNYANGKAYLTVGSTEIAGSFNGNDILFQIPSGLSIPSFLTEYVTLKIAVNNSSGLGSGSVDAFYVKGAAGVEDTAASTGTRVRKSNGTYMDATEITTSSLAISNYFLFHDAAPVVTASSGQPSGGAGAIGTTKEVGKITVTNQGQVKLNLTDLKVTAAATGLATGGSISNFRLYDDAGTLLDTSNDIALTSTVTSGVYEFDISASNVNVSAGESRTFTVKANTSAVLTGKTTGTITLSLTVDGSSGYSATGGTGSGQESYWADSNVQYKYTPVGSSTAMPSSGYYDAADNAPFSINTMLWTL